MAAPEQVRQGRRASANESPRMMLTFDSLAREPLDEKIMPLPSMLKKTRSEKRFENVTFADRLCSRNNGIGGKCD
jgi:hypothetical protein